jgi:hypothetical protein
MLCSTYKGGVRATRREEREKKKKKRKERRDVCVYVCIRVSDKRKEKEFSIEVENIRKVFVKCLHIYILKV